jgi:beta-glucosidase
VPRPTGQLPDYYYQKPSAKREYLGSTTKPLYPFGWGLSYSTFRFANLRLSPDTIGPRGQTTVSVDVTNTGKVRGDEVVQLYIRDEVSSVTRPVKELRGFQRITLRPGETKTVQLSLGPSELSFLNREMQRVVEPAVFRIMVRGNSEELIEAKLSVVEKQVAFLRLIVREALWQQTNCDRLFHQLELQVQAQRRHQDGAAVAIVARMVHILKSERRVRAAPGV